MKKKTVWLVEIPLNDSIVAVGTTEAIALHNCGVAALKYLNNAGVELDEDCNPWEIATIAEYFGYRSTELELDGVGDIG